MDRRRLRSARFVLALASLALAAGCRRDLAGSSTILTELSSFGFVLMAGGSDDGIRPGDKYEVRKARGTRIVGWVARVHPDYCELRFAHDRDDARGIRPGDRALRIGESAR